MDCPRMDIEVIRLNVYNIIMIIMDHACDPLDFKREQGQNGQNRC